MHCLKLDPHRYQTESWSRQADATRQRECNTHTHAQLFCPNQFWGRRKVITFVCLSGSYYRSDSEAKPLGRPLLLSPPTPRLHPILSASLSCMNSQARVKAWLTLGFGLVFHTGIPHLQNAMVWENTCSRPNCHVLEFIPLQTFINFPSLLQLLAGQKPDLRPPPFLVCGNAEMEPKNRRWYEKYWKDMPPTNQYLIPSYLQVVLSYSHILNVLF